MPRCLTCLALLDPATAVVCDKCGFPFCSEECATSALHTDNECAVFPYRCEIVTTRAVNEISMNVVHILQSIVDSSSDNLMMVLVSRLPTISDYEQEAPQYDCITTLRLLLNKQNNPAVWNHLLLHKWADSLYLMESAVLTYELS